MEKSYSGWSNKLHLELLHRQMDRRRVRFDCWAKQSMVYFVALIAFVVLGTRQSYDTAHVDLACTALINMKAQSTSANQYSSFPMSLSR